MYVKGSNSDEKIILKDPESGEEMPVLNSTLERILNNEQLSSDIADVIVAASSAGLLKYRSTDNMTERFGLRVKKGDSVSFLFGVINGMANEIDRLNVENEKLKTEAK